MTIEEHQYSREFPPRLRCDDDLPATTTGRHDDDPLLVATPTMVRGLCQGQAALGPRPDRQRATAASVTALAPRRDSQRSDLREQQLRLQRRGLKVGADPSNRTCSPRRYQWPQEWPHTRLARHSMRRRPHVRLATSQGRVRIILINIPSPRVCRWQRRPVPFPPYRQLKQQDLADPPLGGLVISALTRRDPPLSRASARSRFLLGTLAIRLASRTSMS